MKTDCFQFRKLLTSLWTSDFIHMPRITGNCGKEKPIISVGVLPALPTPSTLSNVGEVSEFAVIQCRALIDTGADGTSLCTMLARSSGLKSYGKRAVIGINGQNYHRTWGLYLGFFSPTLHILPEPLLAIEIPDNQWFEVIIGRDVLQLCDFTLKRGGDFELIIPDS
jgi:hypothetical protein